MFTTSLSPSVETREFARTFSDLFYSFYLNRGKKSFSELINKAESMGCSRVGFVIGEKGKPKILKLVYISKGEWNWIDQELEIGKYSKSKVTKEKRLESSILSKSKKINEIFGLESNPFGNTRELSYLSKKLLFKENKKEVFAVEVNIKRRNKC